MNENLCCVADLKDTICNISALKCPKTTGPLLQIFVVAYLHYPTCFQQCLNHRNLKVWFIPSQKLGQDLHSPICQHKHKRRFAVGVHVFLHLGILEYWLGNINVWPAMDATLHTVWLSWSDRSVTDGNDLRGSFNMRRIKLEWSLPCHHHRTRGIWGKR